jgi:hypothetical protein
MALIGAEESARACVAIEHSTGESITEKEGALLRGEAHATTDGIVTEATFDVSRATRWEGVETETITA